MGMDMDLEHTTEDELVNMKKWFFKENIRIEQQKKELEEERKKFEQLKRKFDSENSGTIARNQMMKKQLEQQSKLFDMKWKILEDELVRLAEDKLQIKKEREEYQALKETTSQKNIHLEMFFIGVNSKETLKKRYKDLIKIFHPDNMNGDNATLQEINRAYDSLSRIFA